MSRDQSSSHLHAPLTDSEVENRISVVFRTLARFSVVSVVDLAARALAAPKQSLLHDMQTMPWISLLLVEFAFRNKTNHLLLGTSMPGSTFDSLREELWQMIGSASLSGPNIQASLRSYLPTQIEFQVTRPSSAMRWPILVNRLPANNDARRMFVEVFQITPEQYIDAVQVLLAYTEMSSHVIPKAFVENLPEQLSAPLSRIMGLISRNLLTLRSDIQKNSTDGLPQRWELNQISFAAKFPLFELESGDWFIWHPRMLKRALEELPHKQLMSRGDQYLRIFTRHFENYVTELTRAICPNLIEESQWKEKMGCNASAVEAIVPFDGVNVFIEAKMSYNHDAALLVEDPGQLVSRLERVTDAVYQARKVSQRLRNESYKYPRRAEATEEFLIVVTSRDLYIGHGARLEELLPPGQLDFDDVGVNERMPLSNILVVSIDDFERLQAAVSGGRISLLPFLRKMAVQNTDAATASLFLSDQLYKTIGPELDFTALIGEGRRASRERVVPVIADTMERLQSGRKRSKTKRRRT